MQIPKMLSLMPLCGLLLAALPLVSQAQTTATWTGPTTGGEWNTGANWSTLVPPGLDANGTTNAIIPTGKNISFALPTPAVSFGALTNDGVLNILANGFTNTGTYMLYPGGTGKLYVGSTGVVDIAGSLAFCSNSVVVVSNGAVLNISGSLLVGCGSTAGTGSATVGSYGMLTNNGGTLTASSTYLNPGNGSVTVGCLLVINGGTNNLGATSVKRSAAGSSGFSTYGTEGLIINGGLVNMTTLNVGGGSGNSFLSTIITGGLITNSGTVSINQGTASRASRVVQTGGLWVVPDPLIVNPNPTVASSLNNYAIMGGTNIVGGFYFGNSNLDAGTVNFTNAAAIYVGSQGINSNGAVVLNASLNSGGMFGATAPWSGNATMKLTSGMFTFSAADPANNTNGITLLGVLNGNGGLIVAGGGTLTLSAADTYSGNTLIENGTLALGSGGSLASPSINVGRGTIFDVTAAGGYTVAASQTLAGFGTVNGSLAAASGATIYPGSNSLTGTLTFAGGLTESGGVNNQFNLSSNPTGPNNDFINATGGLTLSGSNLVTIIGSLASGGVYPLFGYGSSFSGSVANFGVSGATGVFSNSSTAGIIYFIAQSSVRGPTNVTWIGNVANNIWDTEISTNWLNVGAGALDFFVPEDNALFSNLGASNSVVNITGNVVPGSITVNTSSNYTFTGNGAIGGTGSLTISNGSLTLLTTNVYTGPTIIDGGVLAVAMLANSGSPSAIGEASSDPGNLILNGGTFSYFGASVGTDHGLTLTNLGGMIDVSNDTTLTLNGTLAGNGSLTLVDTGILTLTGGNLYTGGTTISNGTMILDNIAGAGAGAIALAGGTLELNVSGEPTFANNLTILANSTLVSAGGNNNILGGNWTGGANVTLSVTINSAGTLSVNGAMTNFYGTIELGNNTGYFRFNAGGGNTQYGATNATIDLGTNTVTLEARNPGTMAVGALEGSSGTFIRGPSSTAGTLIWAIGSNPNVPNSTYWGNIGNSAANEIGSVSKIGNGTLTLGGQNTYTGETTINSGVLALTYNPTNGADGSINDSATINLVSGTDLDVSGRSDDTLQLGSSVAQTLEGRGTILGNLTVASSGTVAPGGGVGGSTGTLTVTNAVTLSGTAWMKLNRANTPNSDQIVSTLSTVTYGGTLIITNIGAALQPGDTFTLFSGSGLSGGSFSSIVTSDYYGIDTSKLAVNGTITVTNVFKPAFSAVNFSSLANGTITLNVTNGPANGTVNVLTSTNLALPLNQWTTNSTATFDGNGNLSSDTITVDQTVPQLFLQLQAQ
jgi:autotransporter-associated beta strand protein